MKVTSVLGFWSISKKRWISWKNWWFRVGYLTSSLILFWTMVLDGNWSCWFFESVCEGSYPTQVHSLRKGELHHTGLILWTHGKKIVIQIWRVIIHWDLQLEMWLKRRYKLYFCFIDWIYKALIWMCWTMNYEKWFK